MLSVELLAAGIHGKGFCTACIERGSFNKELLSIAAGGNEAKRDVGDEAVKYDNCNGGGGISKVVLVDGDIPFI